VARGEYPIEEKSKDYKVPALEKGLEILEKLSESSEPLSLTELSHALGRGASELFRMIGFLVERGYVIRDASGNYRLSLKLYELSHRHSPVEQLLKAAVIPMRELSADVGESCHLSVLHDRRLVVLYQQDSPKKYRFSVEVGANYEVTTSVSGRLLLAYLSPEERNDVLANNAKYVEMAPERRQKFAENLALIVEQGYSYSSGETHVGVEDIAVLVGNSRFGMSAALCIPRLSSAEEPRPYESLLAPLRQCAAQIARGAGLEPFE